MKKLKIKYVFSFFIIILFILSIINTVIYLKNYQFINKNGTDRGIIVNIDSKKDYKLIKIKSKNNYVAYFKNNKKLKVGDKIEFKYEIYQLNSFNIPNIFNYLNYLKSHKIKGIINIKDLKVINSNKIISIKNKLDNIINKKKSKKYIYTFLYSDKNQVEDSIKESYVNMGISHHLCVSGFHIIMLLTFIKSLFSNIFRNNITIFIILLIISFAYLFLTDYSVALTRAVLIYFLYYINKSINLNIDKLLIFILVLSISLLINPGVIYNIGFWYSFILSYFLLMYGCKYNNILKINLFSFLISIPLTIYINYKINLLAFIYSTIYFYVICYVMYPLSFLALLSNIADVILYKISNIVEYSLIKLSNIKAFIIIFPKLNIILIVLIYTFIILYLHKHLYKYLLICILLFIYSYLKIYFDKNIYIYYLDVHQGDMSVIISKHHKNITIIDTGGIENNTYLFNAIKNFLYSKKITKINHLIITHGDFDHMGEAINLVNNFKVEKVIFNCGEFNNFEKKLIKVLDNKKINYYSCIKELNIDKNKLYFLQTKEFNNENDNSNVIYIKLNGYKFMFMGDASTTTEKEIMSKYNLPDIDILKVGHHGSKTSSGKEFIDEINPKYSIISVGKNNRYGHPNKEALENLKDSKLYRTDVDGSIMFKINNNELKIETCSP